MVPPGRSFPSCSARRMIPMAARSFRLPPGLRYSSLAKTSPDPDGTRRLSCSMGVSPTSWVMSSATRRRDTSEVFRLTLQGTGEDGNRQSGGKGGNTYLEWLLRTDERSKTHPVLHKPKDKRGAPSRFVDATGPMVQPFTVQR